MKDFAEKCTGTPNNQQTAVHLPFIIKYGCYRNAFNIDRAMFEVMIGEDLVPQKSQIADGILSACNGVRNEIEAESNYRQTYYYEVQFKEDIHRGRPGFVVFLDCATNEENMDRKALIRREIRKLPRFMDAVEDYLADFRAHTPHIG